MKRWFVITWIGLLLLPLLGCQAAPVSAQTPPEDVDLHREIQLLNLINGLELTPEQMRFILEKAEEAKATRETLKAEADIAETEAVLAEIRDVLMAGQHVSDGLRESFFAARGGHKELVEAYKEEAIRLGEEIEEILESDQLYTVEHYVPCVIPPEGEPLIGQAQDGKGVAVLKRLRNVPDDRFERRRGRIARRLLRELERRSRRRIFILNRRQELHRILDLLEQARSLSDVDFELQKQELIEALLAPYEAIRPPADATSAIARHLLDPAIIPLLQEKLALLGE